MKVVQEPNWTVRCQRCNAVIEFTKDDVRDAGGSGGKHYVRKYKAIDCPCCNKAIEVWRNI